MSAKNIQEFDLTLFQRANYPTMYSLSTSIYPQLLLTNLRKMWELDQISKIYGGNIIVSISSSSFIIEVTTEAALGLIGGMMGLFTGFSSSVPSRSFTTFSMLFSLSLHSQGQQAPMTYSLLNLFQCNSL